MTSTGDRLVEVRNLYCEYGTLEGAALHLGITRERVRQLLNSGVERGLYRMPRAADFIHLSEERLREDYVEVGSIADLARKHKMPHRVLMDLLKFYGLDIETLDIEREKTFCIRSYRALQENLGMPPSTTNLQATKGGHKLYNRIKHVFGSFAEFRRVAGLPEVKPGRKPRLAN